MPSIWENITRLISSFVTRHDATLKSFTKCLFVAISLSLLLEVLVFNVGYFKTAANEPMRVSAQLNLPQTENGLYKVTEYDHTLEFSDLNTEINNIRLDFDTSQPAQLLDIKIHFTDAAHLTYFDSTEYTEGVPVVKVSTINDRSGYININASGPVDSLRVDIGGEDIQYPVMLQDVYINAIHPFHFNGLRFLAVVGILSLVYVFRPGSSIYRCFIVERPRKSKAVIIATVAVELVLMSAFLFYGSNLVGVASANYNWGSWDGISLVNTFETGGENAQQYAELAKSMAQGKVALEEEPPQWLIEMDDPYDKGARDEAQKLTGEAYLFDVAYHDGQYYVYFGVVPVLLFYLPFFLITGANFPTAIGVLLAGYAFVLGCTVLLDRFARYHFKRVSLGLYLLLQIPLVACSGVLYLVKFPTFYSLPIMLALAFSVWGLYFWMKGRLSSNPGRWYLAGSICMALVLGCRPTLVVLSLLAFPLFWRRFITERHVFTPKGVREFACLLGPYFVVGAGLLWYNYIRFGSFLDFGASYNLTVNDMTKRGFVLGRLAPAFFSYFLQPPNITGAFPFVHPASFETSYMGQTIKEVTFGGIFACLPLLWVLPFSRRILQMRIKARSTRTVAGVIIVLISIGFLIALMDAQVAGILQRYFADFSFMFLAASVLLVFIVNENLEQQSSLFRTLLKVLIVLVTCSVLYSILVCFVPETGWYSDIYAWSYQDLVRAVQFWT